MFEMGVQDGRIICIKENHRRHEIPLQIEHWNINDLLMHWAHQAYDMLDGYATRILFTSMIAPGAADNIRAFLAVRTHTKVHFDDIYIKSPWLYHPGGSREIMDYHPENSKKAEADFQYIYDYKYNPDTRIPEFSISIDELHDWHYNQLLKALPENYGSDYRLQL